jgi:hypothetical protein
MNIAFAIMHLFPDAEPMKDFVVMDEGNGQFISEWNIDAPIPTEEELQKAWEEYLANRPEPQPTPEERIAHLEQENEQLKEQIELMQQALDDLILSGGGL